MDKPRTDRLAEFFRRLEAAPGATSMDAAIELLNKTLDAVEDEMTTIQNDPSDPRYDERMKGVDRLRLRDVSQHPCVKRHRHTAHVTFVATNGAIEIRYVKTDEVQFQKYGSDGRGVWDYEPVTNTIKATQEGCSESNDYDRSSWRAK